MKSPSQAGFTAHNIRLNDGSLTMTDNPTLLCDEAWTKSVIRTLRSAFPRSLAGRRIIDLGCLEGGFTVEFARAGMSALGIEVRSSNYENCKIVKAKTDLPHLHFAQDDAWNMQKYGVFDATFCCGLLYHLDRPVDFLRRIASVTTRLLVLNTHFSCENNNPKFGLSNLTKNEGREGCWQTEFQDGDTSDRDGFKWASWENNKSFWLTKPALLSAIRNAGFNLVYEQFDWMDDIPQAFSDSGEYKSEQRGMFVGIKV